MNKKIKVIELLNKIANGEELPKEIKFDNEVFVYIGKWEQYVTKEEEIPLLRRICDYNYSGLNDEVEILEDNTEEIEEIKGWGLATDYKDFETINHTLDRFGNKINELVKAIKEIRKDLKDE